MLGTNIGAYVTSRFALTRTLLGVGVGNPGATDGAEIDRFLKRPLHMSAKLVIGYKATMASGHTLVLTCKARGKASGGAYADLNTGTAPTITANNDGSAVTGTVEVDVNLIGAPQYLQGRVTPVLSASGSDVAEVWGAWVFGGGETIPPAETTA